MRRFIVLISLSIFFLSSIPLHGQVENSQLGAWYMYFWNTSFKEGPWGLQGDIQYRNWDLLGDLQQLMLRGGLTYTPANTRLKLTLGYASITTGTLGEGTATFPESRIYQEALLPQKVGKKLYLTHRFRYEQRWIRDQDMRTRWRYNIFANVPFNKEDLGQGAVYFAFYNELFINGERGIGNGRSVEIFAVNRTYLALGYSISSTLRAQFGYMKQTTDNLAKGQWQVSLHHKL